MRWVIFELFVENHARQPLESVVWLVSVNVCVCEHVSSQVAPPSPHGADAVCIITKMTGEVNTRGT